jgi:hypothetical protein
MRNKVIHKQGSFRIIEIPDEYYNLDDAKGDSFCSRTNPNISAEILKEEELKFERLVETEGMFGYVLERWNPEIDVGWEHVDSCWGFVGSYDPKHKDFNHYIIDEMKGKIK